MKRRFITFGRSKTSHHREIVQICPLPFGVNAVFLNSDGSLLRNPQLALVLYDHVEHRDLDEDRRTKGLAGFLDSAESGGEFADECTNFIGYEYNINGQQKEWTEEIADVKARERVRLENDTLRSIPSHVDNRETAALLHHAQGCLEGSTLFVRPVHGHLTADYLRDEAHLQAIAAAAQKVYRKPVSVVFEPDEERS